MSRICNSLVLAAFAFTAGCASDDQSAPVERVAGGHCITAVTVTGGDATSITLGITGTCDLAQLGHTTMAATQTVSTVNGSIVNSTTYTAANGDKLESGFVGQTTSAPGADVVFTGTEAYKSGTGRFVGVSGSSALNGTAVLVGASGTGQYTTTGKFTY